MKKNDEEPQTPKRLQPELRIWFLPFPVSIKTNFRVPVQPVPERVNGGSAWAAWVIAIGLVLFLIVLPLLLGIFSGGSK